MIKIYTYKNYDFQIGINLYNKYEVCDLTARNIFGSASFDTIQEAKKELKIYINLTK